MDLPSSFITPKQTEMGFYHQISEITTINFDDIDVVAVAAAYDGSLTPRFPAQSFSIERINRNDRNSGRNYLRVMVLAVVDLE